MILCGKISVFYEPYVSRRHSFSETTQVLPHRIINTKVIIVIYRFFLYYLKLAACFLKPAPTSFLFSFLP